MTKGQEWKGVERLAGEVMEAVFDDDSSLTSREVAEAKLRERIEPLLEAADGVANHCGMGTRGVVRFTVRQSRLQKELDKFRG